MKLLDPIALTLAASLVGACGAATGPERPATTTTNAPTKSKSPWAAYAKVLPSVVANALPVDPKLGYLTKQVKPGVYVVTDGVWQSAFVTTGAGVVVIDAPEAFAAKLPKAIANVTKEPVRMLVYTHAHKDHIGGSAVFANVPKLEIVALESTKRFLAEKKDPKRLVPTTTFTGKKVITMGSKRIELASPRNFHSNEGDVFVYLPAERFLMVVDVLAPGYVPFMNFDLTSNFHEYLKVFDDILAYEFDVFVGGHLSQLGTRKDVEQTRDYARDVYTTTKRVHAATDLMAVMVNTAKAAGGFDNKYLLFKAFLDKVVKDAAAEITTRWASKLASVDVFVESHVRTALIYVRWDD